MLSGRNSQQRKFFDKDKASCFLYGPVACQILELAHQSSSMLYRRRRKRTLLPSPLAPPFRGMPNFAAATARIPPAKNKKAAGRKHPLPDHYLQPSYNLLLRILPRPRGELLQIPSLQRAFDQLGEQIRRAAEARDAKLRKRLGDLLVIRRNAAVR